MELKPGSEVDRYRVEGLVGAGGMARVYRARHTRLGSLHAVKVLRLPTPSVIERLLREGRAQSNLRHPNILPVTDVIDVRGAPGLVMEWVEGPSIGDLLATHRLTTAEARLVATGIIDGVAAAHAQGLVHRDLKPGNVLLQTVDARLVPRVTDFGLVKVFGGETGHTLTQAGAVMGTPAYMAPEQLLDSQNVDHRADVWAIGVMLFELWAGERPFRTSGDLRQLIAQFERGAPDIQAIVPGLPAEAAALVHGALEVDPLSRIADLETLAARLQAITWPTGDAPVWREQTLQAARACTPELLETPSRDTLDTLGTSATASTSFTAAAHEALVHPDVSTIEPSPPSGAMAEPRTSVPWIAGLAIGSALVVGAVAIYAIGSAEPDGAAVPTVAAAPLMQGPPDAQAHLDAGWSAFVRGDRAGAIRQLEAAKQSAPESPWPSLMLGYALMRDGQNQTSIRMTRDAVDRWTEHPGAAGSLLHTLGRMQDAGTVDVPEMVDHLERYPDDLLARMMRADWCSNMGRDTCRVAIDALREAAPDSPVTSRIAAQAWWNVGDADATRDAIASGLVVSPEDPVLLDLSAREALENGDLGRAHDTLDRLRAVAPGALGPRLLAVQRAVLADDSSTIAALRTELTAPSQPVATRLRFFDALADTLMGMGRTHEAEVALEEALGIAREDGSPLVVHSALLRVRSPAHMRRDLARVVELLEQSVAWAAQNPEVPRSQRDRLTGFLLRAKGALALQQNDLDGALFELERMKKAPDIGFESIEYLEREIAVHRREADRIPDLGRSLWQGTCAKETTLGDALLRAGDPEAARPRLERALNARCGMYGAHRATRVLAHVALGEVGLQAGDRDEARSHAEAAAVLWPRADPEHYIAIRLTTLTRDLASGE